MPLLDISRSQKTVEIRTIDEKDANFLHSIPQPLYKYRVWEERNADKQNSRRILTDMELYFASADQFNDPFDASLPFRYDPKELTPENIFLKLLKVGKREYPDLDEKDLYELAYERQKSGDFESGKYWKSKHPQFKKDLNEKYGLLSLSSKKDNLLMWSHYADSHKGFCVGLDKYIIFECCQGQLGRVTYDDNFPFIPLFDDSPLGMTPLLATKSTHWEYEDEYRIIKFDGSRKVVKIPEKAVLEIVIGCNMSNANKEALYQLADEKFRKAKVFETQINDQEFKLDFLPILRKIE